MPVALLHPRSSEPRPAEQIPRKIAHPLSQPSSVFLLFTTATSAFSCFNRLNPLAQPNAASPLAQYLRGRQLRPREPARLQLAAMQAGFEEVREDLWGFVWRGLVSFSGAAMTLILRCGLLGKDEIC